MPWGTLQGVKEWLGMSVNVTVNDTELLNIQVHVNRRIQIVLRKYVTDPSVLSPVLTEELADIENQWVAGIFKVRRSPVGESKDHPFIVEAKERLQEFIDAHFRQEFWKTPLKTIKSAINEDHGSLAKVEF